MGGVRGGRGFRLKPLVGGLITSEGQRCLHWLSQPCLFCTAGVCWRLINCCQGVRRDRCDWQFGFSKSDEKQKHGRMEATHWSALLVFHHLICLNDSSMTEDQLRHRFNWDFHHQPTHSSTCCFLFPVTCCSASGLIFNLPKSTEPLQFFLLFFLTALNTLWPPAWLHLIQIAVNWS